MKKRFAIAGLLAAIVCVIQSCSHKDLCYDHDHVVDFEIKFDWSKAPDAAPNTMVVHFFTPEGHHYRRYEFSSQEGGSVKMEAGTYKLLFHNGEMENVGESGYRYDEYALTTSPILLLSPIGRAFDAPRPEDSKDEPVRSAPETVWAGASDDIEIKPLSGDQSVTLYPSMVTSVYTVEIRDVKNMTNDIDISGAITGMAECYSIGAGEPFGQAVTLPLSLERPDASTLFVRFTSFGHCPKEVKRHTFTVYTSNKVYKHFDITDQMHEAADPNNIKILLEGLDLPADGLKPSVEEWGEVIDKEIDMN